MNNHLAILRDLIAFDTTSRYSNLLLIAWVEDFLDAHGVAHHRLPNAEGNKASLIATLPGADGETIQGGIVLSGHTDVVPVDGQPWDTEPFTLTDKGEYLFGRGTADMKGFLACALSLIPAWTASPPPRPIHLAFSYDEEIGCLSAAALAAHLQELGLQPALVLIGEPTLMQPVDAHKGIRSFETTVTGLEAHSSNTHLGVNAVMIAAELVHALGEMAAEHRARGDASGRFTPPYTTIHVGTIQGGTARNIIPRECKFLWEIRPLPGADADAIKTAFDARAEALIAPHRALDASVSIRTHPASNVAGLHPLNDETILSPLLHLCGANRCTAVSFGTEGGIFQAAGFPVLVCGPGSIDQAHKPNEFVAAEQLTRCVAFLKELPHAFSLQEKEERSGG